MIFLNILGQTYNEEGCSEYLKQAGEKFNIITINIQAFCKNFPFGLEGKMREKKLQKGVKIIQSNYRPMKESLVVLRKALTNWT